MMRGKVLKCFYNGLAILGRINRITLEELAFCLVQMHDAIPIGQVTCPIFCRNNRLKHTGMLTF